MVAGGRRRVVAVGVVAVSVVAVGVVVVGARGGPGGGVGGVVGVDGAFGVEDGLEQFAALEVEVAAGEQPAGAVVLEAQPQAAVVGGLVGAVVELLGQQCVEQQREGAGQLAGFDGGGEHEQRVGEPVELAGRSAGDALEPGEQVGQERVGVVEAAAGLADGGEDAVDDDGGDGRFAGLAVDEAVGPVEVGPGLDQRGGDPCGAGDRQPAVLDGCGDGGERRQAAGERDLGAGQAGLLGVEPARRRRGVGERCAGCGCRRRRRGSAPPSAGPPAAAAAPRPRRRPAARAARPAPAPAPPPPRAPGPAAAPTTDPVHVDGRGRCGGLGRPDVPDMISRWLPDGAGGSGATRSPDRPPARPPSGTRRTTRCSMPDRLRRTWTGRAPVDHREDAAEHASRPSEPAAGGAPPLIVMLTTPPPRTPVRSLSASAAADKGLMRRKSAHPQSASDLWTTGDDCRKAVLAPASRGTTPCRQHAQHYRAPADVTATTARRTTMPAHYYAPHRRPPGPGPAAHRPGDVHRGLRRAAARHDARHRRQLPAALGADAAVGAGPAAVGLRRDLLAVPRRGAARTAAATGRRATRPRRRCCSSSTGRWT